MRIHPVVDFFCYGLIVLASLNTLGDDLVLINNKVQINLSKKVGVSGLAEEVQVILFTDEGETEGADLLVWWVWNQDSVDFVWVVAIYNPKVILITFKTLEGNEGPLS